MLIRKISEHQIQKAYFDWVRIKERSDIRFLAIFAIPNAGLRTKQNGARMKAEGMRAGMPDVFVGVPIKDFAGLWIEVKKPGGKISPLQKKMLGLLSKLGYKCSVCYSVHDLIKTTEDYLNGNA